MLCPISWFNILYSRYLTAIQTQFLRPIALFFTLENWFPSNLLLNWYHLRCHPLIELCLVSGRIEFKIRNLVKGMSNKIRNVNGHILWERLFYGLPLNEGLSLSLFEWDSRRVVNVLKMSNRSCIAVGKWRSDGSLRWPESCSRRLVWLMWLKGVSKGFSAIFLIWMPWCPCERYMINPLWFFLPRDFIFDDKVIHWAHCIPNIITSNSLEFFGRSIRSLISPMLLLSLSGSLLGDKIDVGLCPVGLSKLLAGETGTEVEEIVHEYSIDLNI